MSFSRLSQRKTRTVKPVRGKWSMLQSRFLLFLCVNRCGAAAGRMEEPECKGKDPEGGLPGTGDLAVPVDGKGILARNGDLGSLPVNNVRLEGFILQMVSGSIDFKEFQKLDPG